MSMSKWMAPAAILIAAAATVAEAKVSVIQSASPALAPGSSFAWAPSVGVAYGKTDPALTNEIAADRLQMATASALVSKGYRQAGSPRDADLLVAYKVVLLPGSETRLSGSGGCRFGFCRAPSYSLDTRQFTEGTLVLDLTERQTGRLVWRATSEKRVSSRDASPEKLSALLREMTKSLPPK